METDPSWNPTSLISLLTEQWFIFFLAPRATHLGSINLVTVHVVDGSKITLGNENVMSVYFSYVFTFSAFAIWLNLPFNHQKYLNVSLSCSFVSYSPVHVQSVAGFNFPAIFLLRAILYRNKYYVSRLRSHVKRHCLIIFSDFVWLTNDIYLPSLEKSFTCIKAWFSARFLALTLLFMICTDSLNFLSTCDVLCLKLNHLHLISSNISIFSSQWNIPHFTQAQNWSSNWNSLVQYR